MLCNIDYEHTQSTKAGAPGVDPGQLITESRLFPQRQTDVATDAPRRDREVNADRVLFGGERRLQTKVLLVQHIFSLGRPVAVRCAHGG